MGKKIKRYFRQKFCRHSFVEIRNPETDEFIRDSERRGITIYSYWIEEQCVKCGKIKFEQRYSRLL